MVLGVAACATANFQTNTKIETSARLPGAGVFIYSFLDLRDQDFGAAMVQQVNAQLVAQLNARGVTTDIVTFRESSRGRATSVTGTVSIPVDNIIRDNLAREQVLGADYRLIIVPSDITIYGSNHSYRLIWDLIDVRTGEIVWSANMNGNRTVWWNQNEDAEGRAETFVSGLIAEMTSSGLFAGERGLEA
jgi:hypothetical protein